MRMPETRSTRRNASLVVVSGTPCTRMIRLRVRMIRSACHVCQRNSIVTAISTITTNQMAGVISAHTTSAARPSMPQMLGSRRSTIGWWRVVVTTGSSDRINGGMAAYLSGGDLVEELTDPVGDVHDRIPGGVKDVRRLVGRGHDVEDEEDENNDADRALERHRLRLPLADWRARHTPAVRRSHLFIPQQGTNTGTTRRACHCCVVTELVRCA